MKDIILVTACGGSKENFPTQASKLYKSTRIRHLKKRSDELKIPLYILSSEHGLIHSEKIIRPYESLMTVERANKLKPKIIKQLKKINPSSIVYFKGGARREYLICLSNICNILELCLISFGYANMGDIKKLDTIIKLNK